MIWSFSHSRVFRGCQRQWYYKNHVANARATKDPLRREAYLLSKLQTVWAWRGSLVDRVISEQIVPVLRNKWSLNPQKVVQAAKDAFDRQLEFARTHRLHELGESPAQIGETFAAFYEIEYGVGLKDEDLQRAWSDVEESLTNLCQMRELLGALGSAVNLLAQRTLTFPHFQVTVRAIPDLIVFYENRPPLIIDWKVHANAARDYRLQLACYAIALTSCKPQRDFPVSLSAYEATDVRLLEVQLLKKQQRDYLLSDMDIDEVDAIIANSSTDMLLALGESEDGRLDPFDLPAATKPDTCRRCQFRLLCWKEPTRWDSKQISFL